MLHASDKWTGGVDNFRRALFEIVLDLRRDAMGANYGDRVAVGFIGSVDGRNTLRAEPFHLLGVVNQWTEGANGPSAFVNRFFNHFDGAFDAETESIFISQ